mgnify:CR=1 FL=1
MKKGKGIALLPIGVFLVLYLGLGILFEYVMEIPMGFYNVPIVVAFLAAILVACLQNRALDFDKKLEIMAQGVGDKNIITMLLIFLAAGSFVGVVGRSSAESVAYCMLSLIPARFSVSVLFIVACFVSVAMGTSVGTITLLTPIAAAVSTASGFDLAFCVASVMGGAMFGDNLSFISDTTIAACNGQGCEMKDKFRENFFIVLPAAIVTIVLFFFITRNGNFKLAEELTYNIWRVVPYVLVLVGALIGINVFLVLISGTVISLIVGVATGSLAVGDMFAAVGEGVTGMYDITVISIVVACIVSLVKEFGGIQFILNLIKKSIKGQKGGEIGIAGLSLLVDMCTANNTVAIVMAGPIAKEISEEFDISSRRSASLLDIFTSVGQGMIPYGAQLLSAASLTGLTPFAIMPYLFYPILMAVSAVLFILFRKAN